MSTYSKEHCPERLQVYVLIIRLINNVLSEEDPLYLRGINKNKNKKNNTLMGIN